METESLVTIVVPAFNENESLWANLPEWLRICNERDWSLIVVDDGSQDGTAEALKAFAGNARFSAYRHRANRGYGNALKTGLFHAETEYAVTMDADGQHDVVDVGRLLEAMRSQNADMVIGARVINDTSGAYRRFGKLLLRLIAQLLFSVRIRDLNSGFKLYRTEVVKRLLPWCPGSMAFSDVVTLLHLNLEMHVVEVPIETRPREGGRSTIGTMTAVETLVEIVNVLMGFRPLKIFVPAAGLLFVLGVAWATPFLLSGRGMSGAAMLMILTGLLTAMLGLLAEQMAIFRRVDLPDAGAQRILPD